MHIRDIDADCHSIIIEYLMDEYRIIHKACFAPTLLHLDRLKYPCHICRRNTMQDYLCRACIASIPARIESYLPGPLIAYGAVLYMPVPPTVSIDQVKSYLEFVFGLHHLGIVCSFAKLPILPPTLQVIPGQLLILQPFRRVTMNHFFFRKPEAIPSWTFDGKFHIGNLKEIPKIPPVLPQEAFDHMRSLNALFPR